MTKDTPTSSNKVCPTCGARLSENATRCQVCGRNLTTTPSESGKAVQGPRMPSVTLSLPLALLLLVILLGAGVGATLLLGQQTGRVVIVEPTITPSPTVTNTITVTPTMTATNTAIPTNTALPPVEYTIKQGDTCSRIAGLYNVSINSIILANNLNADCGPLSVGQKLTIPQPTPTASPQPTSTKSNVQSTGPACDIVEYKVKENDTLSSISLNYNIPMVAIKEYNGLSSDTVFLGQPLKLPLCKRNPTPGPTPTGTPPAPYAAANLLLPADGAFFSNSGDTITLQWSAVGNLRQNEAYAINIVDLTDSSVPRKVDYVTESKYIVPTSMRPTGGSPHIFRWWIIPVRQSGSTKEGQPIWEPGGVPSAQRVFGWVSGAATTPKP
jgi:LysM repeat protein